MSEKSMTAYEYMARLLKEYGTSHVFFQEVMMRLTAKEAKEKYGVDFILAHSEGAAGYMADGYARASGRPGMALAQSVGAANLVGGIQDAWFATVPVIALTGKKFPSHQYKNAYQECDHKALYEGVTKFHAEVTDAQQLPFLFRQCYREAVTGKPRPVHLDLPGLAAIETEMNEITEEFRAEPIFGKYPPFRPQAEPELVSRAAEALSKSEKPVIVAGRGAYISGAGEEIASLAAKCDIPVVTSPDGKTVFDETDERWCGIVGGYGMECANKTVRNADLVIFIGTQTADQTTLDWSVPENNVKVIQIDISPAELGKNYPDSVGLPGDAKTITRQLSEAADPAKHYEWREKTAGFVKETLAAQERVMGIEASPIRTEHLCKMISENLPEDVLLVADTGYAAIWSATMIRMKSTQRYMRAAGSLGWAYPASLGAKCGAPERPVMCFTGDGGFYYHLAEMETAMRYGINTVTVINNNGVLSQCVPSMRSMYHEKPDAGEKMLTFYPINFADIARQFGLFAVRVEKAEDIGSAIQEALRAGRPALVEVMTADARTSAPLPAIGSLTAAE